MDLEGFRRILVRWERTGSLEPEEYEALETSARETPEARETFRLLKPLLKRDSGTTREDPSRQAVGREAVDAVMSRMERARRPSGSFRPIAVAAAVLAIVLLLGILGLSLSRAVGPYVIVRFEYAAPKAASVSIVGDFNSWSEAVPMKDADGDGVWTANLRLRKNNVYTYNFLVDGEQWTVDPSSAARIKDAFGGVKSVLRL